MSSENVTFHKITNLKEKETCFTITYLSYKTQQQNTFHEKQGIKIFSASEILNTYIQYLFFDYTITTVNYYQVWSKKDNK